MEHQSLYRKYRSQAFEDVVGQDHVTRTLQNALTKDRVAHAYLFCGPRGTGKTSTARLLAKALNCVHGPTPTPCNQCDLCLSITSGRAMDVVEVDAASETGIDNVREVIINNARYAPAEGRYKVYIIDEVHDLSRAAFDGLLKTLEEPPPHVVFVLATTEIHKVPATIISRCQRFEFRRGSIEEVRSRVEYVAREEGVVVEPSAAALIARAAQGGWRDALSLLEQVMAYSDQTITARDVGAVLGAIEDESLADLTRKVVGCEVVAALRSLDSLLSEGKDLRQLLQNFSDYLRDCLMESMGAASAAGRTLVPLETARGIQLLEYTARAERELRWNTQQRLVMELMLLRMAAGLPETISGSAGPPERMAGARGTASGEFFGSGEIREGPSAARPAPSTMRRASPSVSARDPGTPESSKPRIAPGPGAQIETPAASTSPDGPSSVVVSGGSVDLPAVQGQWKLFLTRVGQRSRRLQALLREAVPTQCLDNVITLKFRQQYHFTGVDDPSARREVEGVLSQILGQPVKIICVLDEEVTARNVARPTARTAETVTDADLTELFPGWEINET